MTGVQTCALPICVSYAVASGVTAILGYTNQQSKDEGAADTSDGSSWYVGANLSF